MTKLYYKLRSKLMQFCNLRLGMRLTRHTPDRLYLHYWIQQNCKSKSVLSIGTAWYTMLLPSLAEGSTWTTVDRDKQQAPFGRTSSRHITADFSKLKLDSQFDVVIVNGVFGWGINKQTDVDSACLAIKNAVKPGGVVLVGYNDLPGNTAWQPDLLKLSLALAGLPVANSTPVDRSAKSMHTFLEIYA